MRPVSYLFGFGFAIMMDQIEAGARRLLTTLGAEAP